MPTKLIRAFLPMTGALLPQQAVVTIGNFDGVHLGHQSLIARMVHEATKRQRPSLLITFEPHPIEFFAREKLMIPRLTRWREKWVIFNAHRVENMLVLKFNQFLANKSASQFVREVLYEALHINHLIVGEDFQFGKGREGDISLLTKMGQSLGYSVDALPTQSIAGEKISSTRIRQALQIGDFALAERLLGRPYSMLGRIQHGDKLGRQLGFPTINIALNRKLSPLHGIYIVYVKGINTQIWGGAASIGTRPSIEKNDRNNRNNQQTLLEIHLLDFNQEIYGKEVEVFFCKKLRDEQAYPTQDLLKQQIAKDVTLTREYFTRTHLI